MNRRLLLFVIIVGMLILGISAYAASGVTTLDKVYSEEQAERGAAQYESHCADCHEGEEPDTIRPKGSQFMEHWREAPLDFVFTHIRTNMPADAPGSLSAETYVDILAYLLRENEFPAGTSDLKLDQLGSIQLVGLAGPQPLPPNAMVRVVGCLLPGPSDTWNMSSGSDPVRVSIGDKSTPEELVQSGNIPPGTGAYRLKNAEDFNTGALKGQKVQAKGVWVEGSTPSVSVLSIEKVGGACEK